MTTQPERSVDGITPPSAPPAPTPSSPILQDASAIARARFALLTLVGLPYVLYIIWSVFLLSVLPDPMGKWDALIPFEKLLSIVVSVGMLLAGLLAFIRIGKSGHADDRVRKMSMIRIALFIVPGIALSMFVPYYIAQEPALPLMITSPEGNPELVAPISITYSAKEATEILARRGLKVQTYKWDLTGDGTVDLESVTPEATGYYEQAAGYNVSATLDLGGGKSRVIRRRVVIPNAVFSYTPFVPVVDEPVTFSVAHLVAEEQKQDVREVQWDFNQDGIPDETSVSLEASYTFLTTGEEVVSVTILFLNQTQNSYQRALTINPPSPNPFPVTIETTPDFLESPPPFQVVFRIVTEEPLQQVEWDFGDGTVDVGERVGHTFNNRKVYQVKASARNLNGQISKTVKVVKVVENLDIPDLSFDGSHTVVSGRISAEAPVSISLTPKTTTPLVDFWWEAPDKASQITSTDTTLKAIFRDQGQYNLVLLAKDAEGRVMRRAIVLEVKPKSENVTFEVRPPQGSAPLNVEFDASLSRLPGEQITGFVWNFGDGPLEEQHFGDAYQEHLYGNPGEYVVTLTVNSLSGKSESATRSILVRAPLLKACFTRSRPSVKLNGYVLFDWKCSTGKPVKAVWKYGDGSEAEADLQSDSRQMDHVFTQIGEFNVELTLTDSAGSTSIYSLPVTVTP